MRLFTSTILLIVCFCFYARCNDFVEYEGLRLDLSALTFNRDIIQTIVPALNRTLHAVFPEIIQEGSFGTKIHVKNIKVTYYKINEERFNLTNFEFHYPVYRIKGDFEAIYFHVAFDYVKTWLGISLATGTGTGAVTNVNSEIFVLFNETEPDVIITHPWDIRNFTVTGGGLFRPTLYNRKVHQI